MIIFGIILASIVMYVLIGFTAARIGRKAIIRESMRTAKSWGYGTLCDKCYTSVYHAPESIDRYRARQLTWMMVVFWPIYSWALMINTGLAADLDRADPRLQALKAAEREKRIEELERELKIK